MIHTTPRAMCRNSRPPALCLPPLSDEAAVEILEFLHDVLSAFESRYGAQIRRYYVERSQHNIVRNESSPTARDDPPF